MPLSDNIGKVAFTTKYAADKVVRTYTGSVSAPAGNSTHTVDHDLGRAVLSESLFSIDNSLFYPVGIMIIPNLSNIMNYVITAVSVSSTQIKMYIECDSSRTVYYKVMLIWPN